MVTNLQGYIAHRILLLPSERRLAKLGWRNNISSVASSRPADVPWMRASLFRSNLLRRVSLKVARRVAFCSASECRRSGCAFNRSAQHRLKSIGWRFEAQGLSRSLIEPQSNRVQIALRDAREVGPSREVLTQQAVGVLV